VLKGVVGGPGKFWYKEWDYRAVEFRWIHHVCAVCYMFLEYLVSNITIPLLAHCYVSQLFFRVVLVYVLGPGTHVGSRSA
jgi:hypothetical protein